MAEKKLSKSTLSKAMWRWFISSAVAMNYENFQGTGFAYSMVPVTRDLYGDDEEQRTEAMSRHLAYYNCTPEVAVIQGLSCAMEEQIASGAEISGDDVVGMKAALMGPGAGIGDAVVQGIIVPIFLALCINLTKDGMVFGPVLYILATYAVNISIMYGTFWFGYKKGAEEIVNLIESGTIDRILKACGIVGCTVMGALIVNFVAVNCGIVFNIGTTEFNIQTQLFDAIAPKILPMAVTLGVVSAINKGKKTTSIMLAMIILGAVLGFLGILA